jgi:hypothetical protein
MLAIDFPGSAALRVQLERAVVSRHHDPNDPTVFFSVPPGPPPAVVVGRIPVEGSASDADGGRIELLLHVVGGFLKEFEIYKVGPKPILQLPAVAEMEITVNEA